MHLGIAADHGGFHLKNELLAALKVAGHEVDDFGAFALKKDDDYPDIVVPMAQAVASKAVQRGIAVCGSGVGASVAANKIAGVRAALISDCFSARQAVEDDDVNVICLGGRVIGNALAWELVKVFIGASFQEEQRFLRRLQAITRLERQSKEQ